MISAQHLHYKCLAIGIHRMKNYYTMKERFGTNMIFMCNQKRGNNFIVVEADNTRHKESVPTLNFDWWNYGGITRDVVLAEMNATFINDYKIQLTKGDLKTITEYIQLDGQQTSQKINIQIPEAGVQIKATTDANGKANFTMAVNNV